MRTSTTGNRDFHSPTHPLQPRAAWDRDPYLFDDVVTGLPTTVKANDEIANNFIVANYNSLGAIDNDDGSSY